VDSNFSSENATLIPRLQEYMEKLLEGAQDLYRRVEGVIHDMEYQQAMLARVITGRDALQEAVLIDMRGALEKLHTSDNDLIQLLMVAHNDIVNEGEVHFPFDSILLQTKDDTVLHIYKLDPYQFEERWPGDHDNMVFYNFTAFLKPSALRKAAPVSPYLQALSDKFYATMEDGSDWQLSEGHFQVRSDSPKTVQFDQAFHLSVEKDQTNQEQISHKDLCYAYLYLFLTQHEKMKAEPVSVPLRRNTKRIKKGQHPYCEYKEVKLGDFTKPVTPPTSGIKGSHSSPKMHIRSGHWHRFKRVTKAGLNKRWYKAKIIGDPSNGVVVKWYKMTEDLDVEKLTSSGSSTRNNGEVEVSRGDPEGDENRNPDEVESRVQVGVGEGNEGSLR